MIIDQVSVLNSLLFFYNRTQKVSLYCFTDFTVSFNHIFQHDFYKNVLLKDFCHEQKKVLIFPIVISIIFVIFRSHKFQFIVIFFFSFLLFLKVFVSKKSNFRRNNKSFTVQLPFVYLILDIQELQMFFPSFELFMRNRGK